MLSHHFFNGDNLTIRVDYFRLRPWCLYDFLSAYEEPGSHFAAEKIPNPSQPFFCFADHEQFDSHVDVLDQLVGQLLEVLGFPVILDAKVLILSIRPQRLVDIGCARRVNGPPSQHLRQFVFM